MKKYILFSLAIVLATISTAQYDRSIGIQGGVRGIGITYKYFLSPSNFIEIDGQGSFANNRQGGFIAGYYGWHNEIRNSMLKVGGLSWFFNLGAHAGYYNKWNLGGDKNLIFGPSIKSGMEIQLTDKFVLGGYGRLYYNAVNTSEIRPTDDYFDVGLILRYIID